MEEDKNKSKDFQFDDLLGGLNGINEQPRTDDQSFSKEDKEQSLEVIKEILENTKTNIQRALDLIASEKVDPDSLLLSLRRVKEASSSGGARILEGVFDGESMVGGDGKKYNVPANYASKSKLVEGDILKLTISQDGSFIYKQIGPIDRDKLMAVLTQDETTGDWFAVNDEGRKWRLLTASVTYFHGNPGDEVVILVPRGSKSQWAAVENIIRK